jgi:hypothetical protein
LVNTTAFVASYRPKPFVNRKLVILNRLSDAIWSDYLLALAEAFEEIFVLSEQDEFAPLIVDGHLGCDETRVALGCEVDDLKRRIQRVPRMYLFKELARQFGEGNEDLSDVMRKKGCAWSGESQDLQTMDHWSAVSVSLGPFDVVMDRVIVRRDCLERRCMRIGECSTRRAKHLSPTIRLSESPSVKAATICIFAPSPFRTQSQ